MLVHDLVDESRPGLNPGSLGDIAWMEWASRHPVADANIPE